MQIRELLKCVQLFDDTLYMLRITTVDTVLFFLTEDSSFLLTVTYFFKAEKTPPPPAPAPHRCMPEEKSDVEAAIKDIRLTLQRTKTLPLKCHPEEECEENEVSPVWIPR